MRSVGRWSAHKSVAGEKTDFFKCPRYAKYTSPDLSKKGRQSLCLSVHLSPNGLLVMGARSGTYTTNRACGWARIQIEWSIFSIAKDSSADLALKSSGKVN